MPQKFENSITHLDELPDEESKHIPLNCLWPIISQDTNLTVIITCSKWTFNFVFFCAWVTAYPLGAPNISEQIDLDDYHPLLRSLTNALNLYEAFPEPNLNSQQLNNLEELMEYLHFKFWKIECHKKLRTFHRIGMISKNNANMFHWITPGPLLVKTEP